jgi:homoserine O-acetyltransferase
MFVSSAHDFINPPELRIAQREILKMIGGKFVLITGQSRHKVTAGTSAVFWQECLQAVLSE